MYDFLIVGTGLYGATFAHQATQDGKRCLAIDRRPHLGGNLYTPHIEGIPVHQYGPHIFHTDRQEIWDFVNSLVPFNRFTYCPLADYRGERYNLPFNMNTFYRIWGTASPEAAAAVLTEQRERERSRLRAAGIDAPRNLEEQALCMVGRDLYRKLVKEYTEKQWGRRCSDLPAFIIRRLPVRLVYDNNYFNDPWQGIPVGGYNGLIEALLAGVECRTGTDFFTSGFRDWRKMARRLVYTGPIDAYFGWRLGRLDWRTVRFETRVLDMPNYQGNAVINYTSHEVPFTRVIEHKHFEMSGQAVYDCPKTVVSEEYPAEYREGMEPFYPVNDTRNDALYQRYKALADLEEGVVFGGRLAEYKYYDMAPVMLKAMQDYRKL